MEILRLFRGDYVGSAMDKASMTIKAHDDCTRRIVVWHNLAGSFSINASCAGLSPLLLDFSCLCRVCGSGMADA